MKGILRRYSPERLLFFAVIPVLVTYLIILFIIKSSYFFSFKLVEPQKYQIYELYEIEVWEHASSPLSSDQKQLLHKLIVNAPEVFKENKPERIIFLRTSDIKNKYLSEYFNGFGGFAVSRTFYITDRTKWESETPEDRIYFASTIYHEWMHVVQHGKSLEDPVLSLLTSLVNINKASNYPTEFIKDYAHEAGWKRLTGLPVDLYYLSGDTESQKQTDYGKSQMVEDQAVAAGYTLIGYDIVSARRNKWIENFSGNTTSEYQKLFLPIFTVNY